MARGLCRSHWDRARKAAGPNWTPRKAVPVMDRFWSKVDRSQGDDACWLWTGTIDHAGYADFFVNGGTPRLQKAHRFSYVNFTGPIPEGKEIDHTCHTKQCPTPGYGDIHRRCVNPAHLEAVDRSTNIRRSQAPEKTHEFYASKTHCKYGHEWTDENSRIDANGRRRCRACNRRYRSEFLARRREAKRKATEAA